MSAALFATTPMDASPALPAPADRISNRSRLAGRIIGGLAVAFLTFDMSIKLLGVRSAVEGTTQLGWQPHHLPILGAIQLALLVLYLVPRTAPLGAVLWTGYLGGAIATHLRLDNPLFSHILFPTYVAAMLWGSLYLRDVRVRAMARSFVRSTR